MEVECLRQPISTSHRRTTNRPVLHSLYVGRLQTARARSHKLVALRIQATFSRSMVKSVLSPDTWIGTSTNLLHAHCSHVLTSSPCERCVPKQPRDYQETAHWLNMVMFNAMWVLKNGYETYVPTAWCALHLGVAARRSAQ